MIRWEKTYHGRRYAFTQFWDVAFILSDGYRKIVKCPRCNTDWYLRPNGKRLTPGNYAQPLCVADMGHCKICLVPNVAQLMDYDMVVERALYEKPKALVRWYLAHGGRVDIPSWRRARDSGDNPDEVPF